MEHRKPKPHKPHPPGRKRPAPAGAGGKRPAAAKAALGLRRLPAGGGYELDLPPSARARAADMEEVHTMLEAGEVEIARDELRWLLDGCHALLEAHQLLGAIAWEENDVELARGHFGYAYQLGTAALPSGRPVSLPYAAPANRPFFEAGRGLALCLQKQGEAALAADVVQRLLALDPLDPLELRKLTADKTTPPG